MFPEDTIAAISTPLGRSGIGIVRLSGSDSIAITGRVFVSAGNKPLGETSSHRLVYGHVIDQKKETVDEVLVSVMRSPRSYTREDIVEINCHGGPVPTRKILELVLDAGARLAEPGEFTRRAFLNGRIDLAQAEAVLDVINSLTEQGSKAAVEQLGGGLSEKIQAIREKLVELTAFVEAYIDFPEEDIEPPTLEDMKKKASFIRDSLKALIDSARYGMILREGIKTAIIGRPNVGKSSLLNALLEQDRAIVTEFPGTTRDVIEEYLNIRGIPVKIMDTAGIREVKHIAEKEGVKRSLRTMEDAGLVLLVLDGSSPLHDTDRELIEKAEKKNTIIVINKSDLARKAEISDIRAENPAVTVSATSWTGLDELKEKIVETALKDRTSYGSGIVTNIRHARALETALKSVDSFSGKVEKLSPEFLSVDLREALEAIGEIIGATTPDDVLNKIFNDFCIGK